jgi:formylglycine-generating enzyme required for sulfatase activity
MARLRFLPFLVVVLPCGWGMVSLDAEPPATITNSIGMKLARIPAGEFFMGSSAEEIETLLARYRKRGVGPWYLNSPPSEGARHRVKITRPFAIGVYEATLGQFRKFVEETRYQTDAERSGTGAYGKADGKWQQRQEFTWATMGYNRTDDEPVVNVSWNDAVAFCQWLSKKEGRLYRLPTEAEWEYACRAGSTGRYFWGDDDGKLDEHAWHGGNSGGRPRPAGQRKSNAWGLYDMIGNAYEYCQDWWTADPYPQNDQTDPTGPASGKERVVRGGSWGTDPLHLRCAFRGGASPAHYNQRDGFRVMMEVK